jgi:hypothetical protein
MLITVAIPTFRRPEGIAAALEAVRPQIAALGNSLPDVSAAALVVDNDPGASARELVTGLGVPYVHEPEAGIAAVRNRALRELSTSDAVIFIDDDEVPEPGWLEALVRRYLDSGADAVAGRVITIFPEDTDPWVRASGAFVRPQRRDGQTMAEAATNNLLLDLGTVTRLGLSFDAEFGLTGGSDSMFTARLVALGGTIRWCEDAVVVEREDPVRFTRRWVLMRTFRFGNTWSRVRIRLARSGAGRLVQRARCVATGVARIGQGALMWVRGAATRSLEYRARGLRTIYRGAGNVAGAIGYAHNEYGRRRKAMGL